MELTLKVVIRCRDFAASRDFYARVLGLPAIEEWDEPQGRGFPWGQRWLRLRDPDGLLIAVYQELPIKDDKDSKDPTKEKAP